MLKVASIKRIQDALLTSGKFEEEDFIITQTGMMDERGSEYTELHVRYVYDDKYYVNADVYSGSTVYAEIAPGNDQSRESVTYDNMKDFVIGIQYWTGLLMEELAAAPLLRMVMLDTERIDHLEAMLSDLPNSYFTSNEAEELMERLSQVESELNKRLSDEIADKARLQDEVIAIQNEVQKLKSKLEILDKKNWFKAFLSRMFQWVERNPKALAQLANITSAMLPEEIKKVIPNEEIALVLSASSLSNRNKSREEIAATERE